jgi:hypothetical protein
MANFHHLQTQEEPSKSTKYFLVLKFYIFYNFTFKKNLNDIILQWVVGLVAKIYKYSNKFVPPCMVYSQNMAKFSCG